jgi:RNA polymerase sigma-70 factor (sigma-E family)
MVSMAGTDVQPVAQTEGGRLGELYLRHADAAVRLAYLLTGERAVAEDLVQDAFVKLAGRLVHLRDRDAFYAYLSRTIVNLAHSHHRRRRIERAYLKRVQHAVPRETQGDDPAVREDLWEAMKRLSDRQRAAIVLRYYEDMSEQRVAEILNCRPGTVKSLLSRGLQILRKGFPDEIRGG